MFRFTRESYFRLRGNWWRLLIGGQEPDNEGDCSHGSNTITVAEGLDPLSALHVVIHEAEHAAYPYLDEAEISEGSIGVAGAVRSYLESAGIRLTQGGKHLG